MVFPLRTTMSRAASLPVARSTIRGIKTNTMGTANGRYRGLINEL